MKKEFRSAISGSAPVVLRDMDPVYLVRVGVGVGVENPRVALPRASGRKAPLVDLVHAVDLTLAALSARKTLMSHVLLL